MIGRCMVFLGSVSRFVAYPMLPRAVLPENPLQELRRFARDLLVLRVAEPLVDLTVVAVTAIDDFCRNACGAERRGLRSLVDLALRPAALSVPRILMRVERFLSLSRRRQ